MEQKCYLVIDNAGGHGDDITKDWFERKLRNKYKIIIDWQVPRSPETNMLDSQAKARFLYQLLLLLATNKRSHKLKQIPCFETSIYEP